MTTRKSKSEKKEEHQSVNRKGKDTALLKKPDEKYQNKELKMGASIDAIISSDLGINIFDPITQEEFTFNGDGILEIKTDFYHMDKVREEWVIQVHHQMICSDYTWGIIAVLNQKGHLKIYPVPRNEELIDDIIYCTDNVKNY